MLAGKICRSAAWRHRAALLLSLVWAVAALGTGPAGAGTTTWNAEDLDTIRISNGTVAVQEMAGFTTGSRTWNGGAQLWWAGATPGDELVLGFDVASAGTYSVSLVLTKASDYGIVSVSVDGVVLNASIDLYSAIVEPTTILASPSTALSAGSHELRFAIVGKNANAAPNYMVGIDTVAVELLSGATDAGPAEPSGNGPGTLYEEDFEDGQAQGWQAPSANWEVVLDGGNHVLRGRGASSAQYLEGSWSDCTLEMRVKLAQSGVNINFLTNGCDRYFVGLNEGVVDLYKTHPCGTHTRLATHAGPYSLSRWYDVKIVCAGGTIDVFMDGARVIQYTDSAPLAAGQIALESFPDSEVYVDNIVVGPGQVTSTQTAPGASTCTSSIPGRDLEFTPSGGEYTVTVSTQAGCAWTASSPCGWVQLNPENNTGPGGVAVTVDANTSGSDRSCALTIAGHSVDVQQEGGRPDLAITSIDACLATTTADWPDFQVRIWATVQNVGNADSADQTWVELAGDWYENWSSGFYVGVLAPGESVVRNGVLGGRWEEGMFPVLISGTVMGEDSPVDYNDANNTRDMTLRLADLCGGAPDLIIMSISACLQTTPADWPDFRVPISVRVWNSGTAASPACEVRVSLDNTSPGHVASTGAPVPGLAPENSCVVDVMLDARWHSGMFPMSVDAWVDSDQDVIETDEDNNFDEIDLKLTDVCP